MLLEEQARRLRENRILGMYPETGPRRRELYPRHMQFFDLGATHPTRGFIAANRVGKTLGGGGYESVMHLTGRYQEWWRGHRFKHGIQAWVAGDTKETVRDITQLKLCGKRGEYGTGLIPRDAIVGEPMLRPNGGGAIDTMQVRHVSGDVSTLGFKSYDQGRTAFQGTEKDLIWLDEEAPPDVRSECVIRLMTRQGLLIETFTPLQGATDVVNGYYAGAKLTDSVVLQQGKALVRAGWDDVPHLSAEDKRRMLAETPAHEHEARSQGLPMLGSGRVYPIDQRLIEVPPFAIPGYWRLIAGMDFGWTHPTAVAWLAHDTDADCVYVVATHRRSETPPAIHAAAINGRAKWIPVAWPHDGENETSAGPQIAKQYRDLSVNMRPTNAKFAPAHSTDEKSAGISVAAGIAELMSRMESGRFKVFSNLVDWFDEFRLYHINKGKIVKERDDLMDATRVAIMDLRFAITRPVNRPAVAQFRPHDPTVGY
jgi:phage terminase large subunit-like protein